MKKHGKKPRPKKRSSYPKPLFQIPKDDRSAAKLIAVLRTSLDVGERNRAAQTLGSRTYEEAFAALTEALASDAEFNVRYYAVLGLINFGRAEAIPHLVKVLASDPQVAVVAAFALGELRAVPATEALLSMLDGARENFRADPIGAALIALEKILSRSSGDIKQVTLKKLSALPATIETTVTDYKDGDQTVANSCAAIIRLAEQELQRRG